MAGGEGREVKREEETGAEEWKDVIKENKEVRAERRSSTQEPILPPSLTSDPSPVSSPAFTRRCQKHEDRARRPLAAVWVFKECTPVCVRIASFERPTHARISPVRAFMD